MLRTTGEAPVAHPATTLDLKSIDPTEMMSLLGDETTPLDIVVALSLIAHGQYRAAAEQDDDVARCDYRLLSGTVISAVVSGGMLSTTQILSDMMTTQVVRD